MANIEVKRTVELDDLLRVDALNGVAFTNENMAHRFTITCLRGGQPYALSGTISGRFMRADGTTVNVTGGTITNGVASIVLPRDCYNVVGRFQLAILCTAGSSALCIYAAVGHITRSADGTVIDTGTVLPSADELRDQLEQPATLIDAANHYDERITAAESVVTSNNKRIRVLENRAGYAVVRTANLYNYVTNSDGVQIWSDGSDHQVDGYETSDHIPVTVGASYLAGYWDTNAGAWGTRNDVIGICAFYDNTGTVILPTYSTLKAGVTAPSGAATMRFSIQKTNVADAPRRTVLVQGDALPSGYTEYWTLNQYIARASALTALSNTVSSLSATVGTKAAAADLQTEVTRATTAEQGLRQNIDSVRREIAAPFSETKQYNPGDYCYHGEFFVRCRTAHLGEWNSDHFENITVADELKSRGAYTFADDGDGNVTIS